MRFLFNSFCSHASQTIIDAPRFLKIAVLGAPNVGKSLLVNRLVRAGVAAVSGQMDTTLRNQLAVITENGIQLAVVDSPGVVGIKHARDVSGNPDGRVLTDPETAVESADHILVVQDATFPTDYILHRILHILHRNRHISSSLVINKIDLLTKRTDLLPLTYVLCNGIVDNQPINIHSNKLSTLEKLTGKIVGSDSAKKLHIIEQQLQDEQWREKYTAAIQKPTSKCSWSETKSLFSNIKGWSHFQAVFFASAYTGEGIEAIRDHLCRSSMKKEHLYKAETVTTKTPQKICCDAVRAEFLNRLPSYVAYSLKVAINEWQVNGEVLQIVCSVECGKDRIARQVLGQNGVAILDVAKAVNESLQNLLGTQLFVRILIKVNGKLFNSMKNLQTFRKQVAN